MTTPDEIEALMNVDSFSCIPQRIVPRRTDRAETADHMAMYRFAATRARGRTLDLGSGAGYGASIIAAAQSVDSLIRSTTAAGRWPSGGALWRDDLLRHGRRRCFAFLQAFPRLSRLP
jgi:hypothetical protein